MRYIIFYILIKLAYIVNWGLVNLAEQRCRKQVTIGKFSRFYKEAEVENLQGVNKIKIGENTHIRGELMVYPYGQGISIGNNSYIGKNTIIRAGEQIIIGNSVLIAHNVTIIDSDSHEIDYIERDNSFRQLILKGHPKDKNHVQTSPIIVDDNVWISYNVCILKGVHIGCGSIVGAGSVVTKDVPPFCLVTGNPARIVKRLNHGMQDGAF